MDEATYWIQVEELLDQVLSRPQENRQLFLDSIPEPAIKSEVASLLSANGWTSSFKIESAIGVAALGFLRELRVDTVYKATSRPGAGSLSQLDQGRNKSQYRSVSESEFVGTSRFQVVRQIGAGGMGVVYEALDRQTNQRIAVKTLARSNAEDLYLFKREFRSLAELTHPSLISLYELFSEGDRWFFTMELVEGSCGFLEALWNEPSSTSTLTAKESLARSGPTDSESFRVQHPPTRLNYNRLRAQFAELAGAINVLHRNKKLHCDLKPSNVLVRSSGDIVLLDFGLVQPSTPETFASSPVPSLYQGHFCGTPAYAAPEQLTGNTFTEAMDWYALGVMLFEALTGQLPYEDPADKVSVRIRETISRSPAARNPTVPLDLDRLCVDLLDPNPDSRPVFTQIMAQLNALWTNQDAVVSSSEESVFFGREAQRAKLWEAFGSLRSGKPVSVRVHGDSGCGKSALVNHFLDELARRTNALILAGRCYEQETVPYKAIDNLIDALSAYLRRLPNPTLRAVLSDDLPVLARLFPVLGVVPTEAALGDPSTLRARAIEALRSVFRRVASLQALVLYIDDLQWGDADSAGVLAGVLAQPGAPALLLLTTNREDTEENSCLRFLSSLPHENAVVFDLPVDPLSREESERLAEILLRERSASSSALIASQSGGNPYLLHELAEQALSDTDSEVEINLDQFLMERVRTLDGGARHLLELLAVSGRPLLLENALRAMPEGVFSHRTFVNLRAKRLLRSEPMEMRPGIAIYHDRIRESILRNLTAGVLAKRHTELATALEVDGNTPAEVLALHLTGAGLKEKACVRYEAAAEGAARALAFDRAEDFFLKAQGLAQDVSNRARIQEKRIHFFSDLARFRDAYAVGREALRPLGVQLPAAYCKASFLVDLVENRFRFLRLKVPEVANLPVSTDPQFVTAVKLLAAVGKAAYQIRAELCIAVLIKMVNLCLRKGNTPDCAIGYMAFGSIFLGGVLGKHRSGFDFGQLSLNLVEKFANRRQEPEVNFVVGYFGVSWMRSAREAESLWAKAYETGMETGDLFHTGCAAAAKIMSWWMRGVSLVEIELGAASYQENLDRLGLREPGGALLALKNGARSIRTGTSLFPPQEAVSEAEYRKQTATFTSRHFALYYAVVKLQTMHFEQAYKEAWQFAQSAMIDLPHCPGMLHSAEFEFYRALIAVRLGGRLLHAAQKVERTLRKWSRDCPENFLSKHCLLAAEIKAAQGGNALASSAYDAAAEASRTYGHVQIEALSHLRASKFHDSVGRTAEASKHISKAIECYQRWGATAWADTLSSSEAIGHSGRRL